MKLRSAIDGQRDYELPERHDPLYLMFDNDFHLGERPPHCAVPFFRADRAPQVLLHIGLSISCTISRRRKRSACRRSRMPLFLTIPLD